MVDVKFLAQRVAELMRGKVLVAAKAGQAVVREGTGPHDLAHGRLVVRVLHGGGAVAEDDAQQTALYKQMERDLTENAANVYIQDMADFVAVRDGLEGPDFYPIYVLDLSSFHYTK